MSMICKPCRKGKHTICKGGTHCPCQHRRANKLANGTIAPVDVRDTIMPG